MSKNPLVLLLAFLLELAGLAAMFYWGWTQHDGILRWLLAIGLPVIAAAIWGIFRVPNDPGPATVAVPGILRLGIEFTFYAVAVLLLVAAGAAQAALMLAALVVLQYALSYDHLLWKIRQ
jgi:hypothetical protein